MIPEEIQGPQPRGSDISCDSPFLRTSVIKGAVSSSAQLFCACFKIFGICRKQLGIYNNIEGMASSTVRKYAYFCI